MAGRLHIGCFVNFRQPFGALYSMRHPEGHGPAEPVAAQMEHWMKARV